MATERLPFEQARARLLAGARVLPSERVALASAAGRVLAEGVTTEGPLPPFDHSAMDGFALRTADLHGSPPYRLAVDGESGAGRATPALRPGTACRIFTGAPVPAGADAVVMQERVRRDGADLVLDERPRPRDHVRFAGEDLAAGSLALAAGTRLSPGAIGLSAMVGRAELWVARRPRVTVVCTGDELLRAGEPSRPGAIFESNSAALAALAQQAHAEVRVAPIVRDDPDATQRAFEEALDGADVLVTVGGVSVGDHDHARPALERAGVTLDFWRIAIKPGKPLAVGRTASAFVLGLPGNPASALVTFAVFGVPLLRALQGDGRPVAPLLPARLSAPRRRSPDRLELARASLELSGGSLVAVLHDNQSSGAATSLAQSDGLAFLPAGSEPLPADAPVGLARWSDL